MKMRVLEPLYSVWACGIQKPANPTGTGLMFRIYKTLLASTCPAFPIRGQELILASSSGSVIHVLGFCERKSATRLCLFLPCSEQRSLLEKCAATALSSKLISQSKDFFSKMVVDAVMMLDDLLQLKMIGIKKVQGGALEVSALGTCLGGWEAVTAAPVRFGLLLGLLLLERKACHSH